MDILVRPAEIIWHPIVIKLVCDPSETDRIVAGDVLRAIKVTVQRDSELIVESVEVFDPMLWDESEIAAQRVVLEIERKEPPSSVVAEIAASVCAHRLHPGGSRLSYPVHLRGGDRMRVRLQQTPSRRTTVLLHCQEGQRFPAETTVLPHEPR